MVGISGARALNASGSSLISAPQITWCVSTYMEVKRDDMDGRVQVQLLTAVLKTAASPAKESKNGVNGTPFRT
ncbi:MAG: hypothetical protein BWY09_03112 [Candidatus Hydrogenedentes bacterium ADurb.Bin179]|nr:MAG: hypothetical protein BWY09_03112 [Candidatus Hydrogenedentes bacterium ADurb.Bin179]